MWRVHVVSKTNVFNAYFYTIAKFRRCSLFPQPMFVATTATAPGCMQLFPHHSYLVHSTWLVPVSRIKSLFGIVLLD